MRSKTDSIFSTQCVVRLLVQTIASMHGICSLNLNNAEWQLSMKIVLRDSEEMVWI